VVLFAGLAFAEDGRFHLSETGLSGRGQGENENFTGIKKRQVTA
jgi:hypothetical protein